MTADSIRHSVGARTYDDAFSSDNRLAPPPIKRRPAWLEWFDSTDPGLMRLRMATEVVVAIGAVVAAEWVFIRATGALQAPIPHGASAATAAEVWTLNHALLVIGMMLGAILALISGFGLSMYASARAQLITLLFLPLPMLALLAIGMSLHVRVLSLALLAVTLAIGTYCRRFGPRGFMGGMLAFMGAFLGFFIQDYIPLGEFGWLVAEIALGAAVTIVVHFALFRPRAEAAVRRMQRSYAARSREVADDIAELFEATVRSGGNEESNSKADRQLQRQLLRLNEAALLIDAQLNAPAAVPAGWSAATLHQRLFDAEVGLGNVARFALEIARRGYPAHVNALVAAALTGIRDADLTAVLDTTAAIRELLEDHDGERTGLTPDGRVLLHRFATSVDDFAVSVRAFRLYPAGQAPDDSPDGEFTPQVSTFGGWLPGSASIAGAASQERGGTGWRERIRLAPYSRSAIQMGVAVGLAIIAGDALSGRRFYWAVIAAFITFMGANTAGEQVRKSVFRVAGTFFGVIVGALLAHLVGDRVALQLVVVLVSLFLGLYLFRINYAFMTIGITVMVSQLYVELGEFSNSLLVLRLEETAIGAGVAIAVVLVVLPLHIGRVARVAARQQVEALADLIDRCLDRLADPASAAGSDLELRASARRLDVAYQALSATVRPMRTPLLGHLASRTGGFLATTVAARHYARNLLLDSSTRYAELDPAATAELAAARRQLDESVAAITTALAADGSADGARYVRSARLFARVADRLSEQTPLSRPQLALRDLQLLDGSLAEAARWAGLQVVEAEGARHG